MFVLIHKNVKIKKVGFKVSFLEISQCQHVRDVYLVKLQDDEESVIALISSVLGKNLIEELQSLRLVTNAMVAKLQDEEESEMAAKLYRAYTQACRRYAYIITGRNAQPQQDCINEGGKIVQPVLHHQCIICGNLIRASIQGGEYSTYVLKEFS